MHLHILFMKLHMLQILLLNFYLQIPLHIYNPVIKELLIVLRQVKFIFINYYLIKIYNNFNLIILGAVSKIILNNRVKALDKYNEYGIEPVEIDIKKCIKYVACAWNNVIESTIKNCWQKTGILPKIDDNMADEINLDNTTVEMNIDKIIINNTNEENEVQALIDKLNLGNSLNANEFIHYDNTVITTEIRTNDEILAAVLPNNENEMEEED